MVAHKGVDAAAVELWERREVGWLVEPAGSGGALGQRDPAVWRRGLACHQTDHDEERRVPNKARRVP